MAERERMLLRRGYNLCDDFEETPVAGVCVARGYERSPQGFVSKRRINLDMAEQQAKGFPKDSQVYVNNYRLQIKPWS